MWELTLFNFAEKPHLKIISQTKPLFEVTLFIGHVNQGWHKKYQPKKPSQKKEPTRKFYTAFLEFF